ncbi:sensor histidine kinase [Nocardioides sp. CER19]|uniref:sensor histidine kinase n=1 Tax=Nocardioides sp. CER19 TaxID=3038538 RepID=UPI0024476188|nr:sensor histidine kinase [Nocardioides sp. CER19]MDH2414776.1 sensor histidine kinase [Nocardioides sp. CER19]
MHPTGARRPAAPWAVGFVVLLTLAAFAASVALDLHTDVDGPGARIAAGWGWSYTLLGLLLAGLAAVILVRSPRQGIGWGLAWTGLFWAQDGLSQSYARFAIRPDDALPLANLALWSFNRLGAFLPLTGALLLLLFPTGRFLPGRWRVTGWVTTLAMGLGALVVVVTRADGALPDVRLPSEVDVDWGSLPLPASDAVLSASIAVQVAGLLSAMLAVVVRYRRSTGLERDRMRWLLWSVVAIALVLVVSAGLDIQAVNDAAIFVIMVLPATAMTIAVVDPRLVAIDDLLARTLVYAVLAGIILAVDLVAIALLSAMLDDSLTERQLVLVVLLVSVVLYGPLRGRLARWVQVLMLGKRSDPYDVVAGLASTLESIDQGPEQLAAVARAVATAFRVRYVAVEVDRGDGERLVATHGARPAQTRSLPIVYRGAEVGRLVLPSRGARSWLSRRDGQLLADLVRQAANAARTTGLAEEVQRSRERLVTAREEERRRIRRDLHDGLGPVLSGVVFQLESARLLVEKDPAAAGTRLLEASRTVQDAVADVRRLVHDLRPPALDDLGLVGALRQLADQLARGGPAISVADDGLSALPAAVEVAAYRIVAEALTNTVRHAGATRAGVRLCAADGALRLEVADDGAGLGEDVPSGVGLRSMRERALELGGRVEVACPPTGGTVVTAVLPIAGGER